MIEYKTQIGNPQAQNTENLNTIPSEESNIVELQQLIVSFIESYEQGEFEQILIKSHELNIILQHNNDQFNEIIINSDLLPFLQVQLNSTLSNDILSIILEITRSVLFNRDETITKILLENGALESLNSYIDLSLGGEILEKVIDCIGYATFDLYKINVNPIFDLKSMVQILEAYEGLYPRYMNLLSNSLFCIKEYDTSIEFMKFYIYMIDLDRCFPHHVSHLFRNIIQRIKSSSNLDMNYYYVVFQETNLSKIICDVILKPKFDEIVYQQIDDVRLYTLKLMIFFLNNDEGDLFFEKIKDISTLDYYNLIISSNSSFKSIQKVFELLNILMRREDNNFYITDFLNYSELKLGKENLFNYNAYFDLFPFKVRVWYLNFLALAISGQYESVDVRNIENLFSRNFIELVISLLDQDNFDISKVALLVINAILSRAVKENLLPVIDVFIQQEQPFEELIDEFSENIDISKNEKDYEEIKKLALVAIRTMSEANTKKLRKF